MRQLKRTKLEGVTATYHAMSRVVGGEQLFGNREKEVLRKMLWQVADFCGVEILTYCVMSNHFHVLVRVPEKRVVSDAELLRRFRVLYPEPTKYQTAEFARLEKALREGDEDAVAIRERLLARMHDLSEFMKTVKQRFSIWYNRSHGNRRGTLWMERFKSVLVEGAGNPLQTMAVYIDLNPVRAGLVEDPKDYRYCGYAEAVAQSGSNGRARTRLTTSARARSGQAALRGIRRVWGAYADGSPREMLSAEIALQAHRELIFGKRAGESGLSNKDREKALEILERGGAILPRSTVLRCRVRYFTDGAILGSAEFVRGLADRWQADRGLKYRPKIRAAHGADWGDLSVVASLRNSVFG
jgi:REP element-mobilizing transposase RayT